MKYTFPVTITFHADGVEIVEPTSAPVPPPAPAPIPPVPPAIPAPTPVPPPSPVPNVPVTPQPQVPVTKLDRTKANITELFSEGGRGLVVGWHYFNVGNGYIYKSPLQDWLAQVLPGYGSDYAHWTDPTSYAGQYWYGLTNDELTRILKMQQFANRGA